MRELPRFPRMNPPGPHLEPEIHHPVLLLRLLKGNVVYLSVYQLHSLQLWVLGDFISTLFIHWTECDLRWNMEGGAPRLDSNLTPDTLAPPVPRSASPSSMPERANPGPTNSTLSPDNPKRERRLSQRLSATFSSALGSGYIFYSIVI